MKKRFPLIAVILAMIIWGGSFFASKLAIESFSPALLIVIRGAVASVILFFFSIRKLKTINKKTVLLALLTGTILALAYIVQNISLQYTSSGMSALLENTYIILVPFLSWLLTRQRPHTTSFIAIGLATIGIILVSISSINFNDSNSAIGIILSIIGGLLFGANIVLTGIYQRDKDPISYTFLQFVTVTVIALLYWGIFERKLPTYSTKGFLAMLYLAFIATALAWLLRNYGQNKLSPITVTIILPFTSVVASIISLAYGEMKISAPFIIGVVILLIAATFDGVWRTINKCKFYMPMFEELSFREEFLKDEKTMAYNHKTIDFSKDKWEDWYDRWLINTNGKRFYRYIQEYSGHYVGEAAYYYDEERNIYLISILIIDSKRGLGYGKHALKLLINEAKKNGINEIYDDIAIDNTSVEMFLKNGFEIDHKTDTYVTVKKAI